MSNVPWLVKQASDLDLRREVLSHCVYAGEHPNWLGWLILFRFGMTQASVVFTEFSNGIEVGVMRGEWLVNVFDGLNGYEAFDKLVDVMKGKV